MSSTDPTSPKSRLSRATKDVAFGSIAGMVSKLFEHPFDLVKVRLQTQPSDRPLMYTGALDCFRQTFSKEGVKGLYRGLSMPVVGATAENACLFLTYNFIQGVLREATGRGTAGATTTSSHGLDAQAPLPMSLLAIAAAGAGAVTSVVLTPIELIKCKMQVQMVAREMEINALAAEASLAGGGSAGSAPGAARPMSTATAAPLARLQGPWGILRHTIRNDGIRGMWLGQTGTLLRETGGGIAWFLAFEGASRSMVGSIARRTGRDDVTKKDLASWQLMAAGALAGVSFNVILFPADCVKSTMQTEEEMNRSRPSARPSPLGGPTPTPAPATRTGLFATFRRIYRTRGIRGLYAGCGVTCLRSGPSSALIFLMYNKLEQAADACGL